jgi:hypothetical protein
MKIIFWNIRGFGAPGRKTQLKELRQQHRVDMICLQETIKENFTLGELSEISEGGAFESVCPTVGANCCGDSRSYRAPTIREN